VLYLLPLITVIISIGVGVSVIVSIVVVEFEDSVLGYDCVLGVTGS
jgi:ABC-type polysaccharide/polyol phosphate export permease